MLSWRCTHNWSHTQIAQLTLSHCPACRLSIIALEDAVLHPALPLLVWLMAALAKGYTLGVALADVCLHVVHQLAAGGPTAR